MNDDVKKMTEEEWKKKLTTEQYHVLREKGTEAPFTNKFVNNFETGCMSAEPVVSLFLVQRRNSIQTVAGLHLIARLRVMLSLEKTILME